MRKSYILSWIFSFMLLVPALAQIKNIDIAMKGSIEANQEHVSFIERLADGESYRIELNSMGCFGGSEYVMTIFRKSNNYFATFDDQTIELTEEDLKDFIGFEQELVNISKGYCTSVDTYTLSYKNEKWSKKDASCSWNGMARLRHKFKSRSLTNKS